MNTKIKSSLLLLGVLAMTSLGAAPRRGGEAGAKLTAIVPTSELKAAMKPYGFKAYRYSDGTNTMQALFYAPKKGSTKGLPLVVYIPGNGERGELIRQFRQPLLFNRVLSRAFQAKFPCHLLAISPAENVNTLVGGMPGQPNGVQRLMHNLIFAVARQARPKVDLDRIYVTGFSYGGDGAYAMAIHYPAEFAAAVPVAALPPLEEYFDPQHPNNLWDVYNEGDGMAIRSANLARQRFRDLTNSAGGDFRLSTYPAQGHDAWSKAWREDEIWNWMFSKSRTRPGAIAGARTNRPAVMTLAGATCTASIVGRDASSGPERALDGLDETAYVPEREFRKSDWWQVAFAEPVSGKVCLYSGTKEGANKLRKAFVEVSSNGRSWRRMGQFSNKDGTCTFTASQKFSYLRVRLLDDLPQNFTLRRMTLLASTR